MRRACPSQPVASPDPRVRLRDTSFGSVQRQIYSSHLWLTYAAQSGPGAVCLFCILDTRKGQDRVLMLAGMSVPTGAETTRQKGNIWPPVPKQCIQIRSSKTSHRPRGSARATDTGLILLIMPLPAEKNKYWIPCQGIHKRVITQEIQYLLGPEATVRQYTRDVGKLVTSFVILRLTTSSGRGWFLDHHSRSVPFRCEMTSIVTSSKSSRTLTDLAAGADRRHLPEIGSNVGTTGRRQGSVHDRVRKILETT